MGCASVQQRPARGYHSNGLDKLLGGIVLEDVADRARRNRTHDGVLLFVGGEHDHSYARVFGANLPAGLDTRAIRKLEIHEYDVRVAAARLSDRGFRRSRFCYDL